jgi:hypothetical protein
MNRILTVSCALLLFFSTSIAVADIDEFKRGLIEQKEKFERTANRINNYAIYTDAAFKYRMSTIDSFVSLFSDEQLTNHKEIKSAGYELLKYLQDSNESYYTYPFDSWQEIADLLLHIDNSVSRGTGWGNVVIKINIANKLFNRIAQFLLLERSELDSLKLQQLLEIEKKMRAHLIDSAALARLAMRHHGKSGFDDIESFKLSSPVYQQSKASRKLLTSTFGDRKEADKYFLKTASLETKVTIKDYLSLYDKPIPWLARKSYTYSNYLWELYLYTLILLDKGADFDVKHNLTQEDLHKLIKREYDGGGRFWMSYLAINYIEYYPKSFRSYLDTVKENAIIKIMMEEHEHAFSTFYGKALGFSVHRMP